MLRNKKTRKVVREPESLFDSAPQVESLESRLLLAGNIRVITNARGDLFIRGDGRSNYVEVSVETTDQNNDGDTTDIVIRGLPDSFGNATMIRDRREVLSQVVLDSDDGSISNRLRVIMGGGDDFIQFRDVTISGDFWYLPGGRNDSLGMHGVTVNGSSSFRTGGGNDYMNIIDTTFNGSLDARTAGGVDYIGFSGLSVASGQTISFNTAGSPDVIYIEDSVVDGNIYANMGSLIDTIYVGDGTVLNGNVTVDMGSLFDFLVLENNTTFNGTLNVDGSRAAFYPNLLFIYDDSPYFNSPPDGVRNFEADMYTISGVSSTVGFDIPTTLSRWVMDVYNEPVINVIDAIVAANLARGFAYADLPRSDLGAPPNPADMKQDINDFLNDSGYWNYQKLFLRFVFQQEVSSFNWYDNS